MANKFQRILFTSSVKEAQEHYGSRRHFEKFDGGPDQNLILTDAERDFIEQRDTFYMATAAGGQPYIQHRGGPPGFLKVLDGKTLGYADFRGNLQYISVGNLRSNAKAALILMDYPNKRRLKILVNTEVIDAADRPELVKRLAVSGYKAKIERAIILNVEGFDWNCPQHITPRYTVEEIRQMAQPLYEHIEKLENEIRALKTERK